MRDTARTRMEVAHMPAPFPPAAGCPRPGPRTAP